MFISYLQNKNHSNKSLIDMLQFKSPSCSNNNDKCEHKIRKTNSNQVTLEDEEFKKYSYVYIIGPRIGYANVINRVAQVIEVNRNRNKYAVRANYNGQIFILEGEHLRKVTDAEKRADKKMNNWNKCLTDIEKKMLYPERQRNNRTRRK